MHNSHSGKFAGRQHAALDVNVGIHKTRQDITGIGGHLVDFSYLMDFSVFQRDFSRIDSALVQVDEVRG
jgi:hypothetical protein